MQTLLCGLPHQNELWLNQLQECLVLLATNFPSFSIITILILLYLLMTFHLNHYGRFFLASTFLLQLFYFT